jgi:hypothetical protein
MKPPGPAPPFIESGEGAPYPAWGVVSVVPKMLITVELKVSGVRLLNGTTGWPAGSIGLVSSDGAENESPGMAEAASWARACRFCPAVARLKALWPEIISSAA